MTLTVDELLAELTTLKQRSPLGGATPIHVDTPNGYCELRAVSIVDPDDDSEVLGLLEVEPAAFDDRFD